MSTKPIVAQTPDSRKDIPFDEPFYTPQQVSILLKRILEGYSIGNALECVTPSDLGDGYRSAATVVMLERIETECHDGKYIGTIVLVPKEASR